MVSPKKQHYPDIFEEIPPEEKFEKNGPTHRRNKRSEILYLAVRHLLRRLFNFDPDGCSTLEPKLFPTAYGKVNGCADDDPDLTLRNRLLMVSVIGHLRAHGFDDPSMGKLVGGGRLPGEKAVVQFDRVLEAGEFAFTAREVSDRLRMADQAGPHDIVISPDPDDKWKDDAGTHRILMAAQFIEAFTDAVKFHFAHQPLLRGVFDVLRDEGAKKSATGKVNEFTLRTRQLAEVTQHLVDDGVEADDPHLPLRVVNSLTRSIGGFIEGSASNFDIDLPNLDAGTVVEIERSNVQAVAAIYFSAMLEELGLYAVMDKVAEHFMIGMVPISRGPASDKIYKWIKDADDRFTEIERRGVYGRVLGLAQGAATDIVPNREFSDLWFRFLSTVSILDREKRSTTLLHVSGEQALKAARDLSVNLSLHGYGIAHPAAVEMQKLIGEMRDVLSEPALHVAYGVRDIWQLVDRVNSMYLGGYVNGVRYRTMAMSGGEIILWLADHATKLASVARAGALEFTSPRLVADVERWLAVTGTPDASVQQFTDPVDLQQQPTVPAFAPTNGAAPLVESPIIRDALDQAGIDSLPAIPQV